MTANATSFAPQQQFNTDALKSYDNDSLLAMRKHIDSILQEREIYKIQLRTERKVARTKVPLSTIVKELNNHLGYDITISNRTAKYTMPRFAVFYILYYEYQFQLDKIGKYYGDKDHSTISHGRDMAQQWIQQPETRPEFWEVYVDVLTFIDGLLGVSKTQED